MAFTLISTLISLRFIQIGPGTSLLQLRAILVKPRSFGGGETELKVQLEFCSLLTDF